jgi:hypothetical protein
MACRAEARQGEGWSQSRVPPSAQLAYETGLSAGSIAMLAHRHLGTQPQNGALTRSCTGLTRVPGERIADYALRALRNGRRETTCTSKAA